MRDTVGIILAAGRGSRMKGFTEDQPKCQLELGGKKLLDWQLLTLRKAGIEEIFVVRGYLAHTLQGDFKTIENPRWAASNMVSSLLCALKEIEGKTMLISYSDIVYNEAHLSDLLAKEGDICITYDTKWEELWSLRNENPLDDAETFREENGLLQEIGGKAKSIEEIKGQYMGLLKFNPKGQEIIKQYMATLESSQIDKLDMTSLLRALLAQEIPIVTCPVKGAWCECDTQEDIRKYEKALQTPPWTHDWR